MKSTVFDQETQRKDQLLTLLEKHEKAVKFEPQDRALKFGHFDRIFHGIAEVTKVGKSSLRLKRENGRPLGVLIVTPEIVALTRTEDQLMVTLGHRMGQWHLMQIQMIGSLLNGRGGESQMHLSISRQNFLNREASVADGKKGEVYEN